VANPVEPAWQYVYQEAAQKFTNTQCEGAIAITSFTPVVFPFERDVVIIAGQQTAVGDSHAMGIAREIVQHRLGSVERPFGIDHPLELTTQS